MTAPTVSDCPTMAITDVAPAGATGMTVTWDVPTATDDSGAVSTTSTANPGSFFPVGTTAVTYTFTDSSGNVAQCIFNVIITGAFTCPSCTKKNFKDGPQLILCATWPRRPAGYNNNIPIPHIKVVPEPL